MTRAFGDYIAARMLVEPRDAFQQRFLRLLDAQREVCPVCGTHVAFSYGPCSPARRELTGVRSALGLS